MPVRKPVGKQVQQQCTRRSERFTTVRTRLFDAQADDLSFKDRKRIESLVKREIEELFHGRNLM